MRKRKHNRHLPPCVYQRHGGFYLVKKGKWKLIGHDLNAALAEYARLHSTPDGTMVKLIDDAMPYLLKGRSESTQRQYKVAANKLRTIFEEFSPSQVTQRVVARMRREMADTPNMTNRCITVLRLVFDYALEEELVESNPCTGVKRLEEGKRDRLIEGNEYDRIYAEAVPRLQCMMDIAFLSGQRLMDVVTIHRADIREEGIYFRQEKTDAKLIVRWTPQLKAAVERAKSLGGKVNALTLFYTRKGTAPDYKTVYDQWRTACKKAGIEDTDLRDLRAMAATHANRQGKNATALLGHASEQMTQRYLRDRETPIVEGPVLDSFGQKANDR